MSSIIWQKPLDRMSLRPNEVHIWRASLATADDFPGNILSQQELSQGKRFVREEHRRRFCVARTALRLILASYLRIDPAQIQFAEGVHGKPYLLSGIPTRIKFNVSHSGDLALYAITLDREIGVDTEWINPDIEIGPLATRFFTAAECSVVLSLPAAQQLAAFYRVWTRKEAYLKALGVGLSGLSPTMTEIPGFHIQHLQPAADYAGAVGLISLDPAAVLQMQYFLI